MKPMNIHRARSLAVAVSVIGCLTRQGWAEQATNPTVVVTRTLPDGSRLELVREIVVLTPPEESAKFRSQEILITNYVNGKMVVTTISEYQVPAPPPRCEYTFVPVVHEHGRTNVYRERALKKKLGAFAPDLAVLDVLHESQATVFLCWEYRGVLGDQSSLVVNVVSSDPGRAGGAAQTQEFVLRSVTVDESLGCLWSGKLLGSYERGTLAVESKGHLVSAPHRKDDQHPPPQVHRFVDGKWVLAEEKPAQ